MYVRQQDSVLLAVSIFAFVRRQQRLAHTLRGCRFSLGSSGTTFWWYIIGPYKDSTEFPLYLEEPALMGWREWYAGSWGCLAPPTLLPF